MEDKVVDVAPRETEVPMIEAEVVQQMRQLHALGWGVKRLAREFAVAKNTVKRYLRGGAAALTQTRPAARKLDAAAQAQAVALLDGAAEGNAVVVQQLLAEGGVAASTRTVQRAVHGQRAARRAAQLATVRVETAPGHQLQIDFGQKLVRIAGTLVRVHLLVAVLAYSRRLFVRAGLAERHDDWREGLVGAFERFGGVPRTLLNDNASPLVVRHDPVAHTVVFHPAYLAFCRDWDVVPRACRPYRPRTKGKTEAGVKYVKRNALAGREFASFAQLEAHLATWMDAADRRVHGTTHEVPLVRFEAAERAALRPLPARPLPVREHRLRRRVANDAFVDVDTVRYSVPHPLVRTAVEVLVGATEVQIFQGATCVATHARCLEPHARVEDPAHRAGLLRSRPELPDRAPLAALGRSLDAYAAVVDAGGTR